MKKVMLAGLLCLFVLLPLSLSASDFYYGGPGRLAGMGVMSGVAINDISSANDLYSAGFVSGLALRQQKNIIAIYPELLVYSSKREPETPAGIQVSTDVFSVGTSQSSGNLGIIYWFSPDTVLCVKPYAITYSTVDKETGDPDETTTGNILAGYADLAQKIGKELTLGLSGGYYFMGSQDKESGDPDVRRLEINKISYQASASFVPDNNSGWSYAVSAGNRTTDTMRIIRTLEMYLPIDEIGLFVGRFDYMNYRKNVGTLTTTEEKDYEYYTGLNTDAAAAYDDKNGASLLIKAGGIFAMSNKDKDIDTVTDNNTGIKTENTAEETDYDNGAGFNAELRARKELEAVILGLGGKVYHFGYSSKQNAASKSAYTYWDSVLGISLKAAKTLLIPAEVAYEGFMNDSWNTDADEKYRSMINLVSARLGAELGINENFTVRAGVDYVVLSQNDWFWSEGNLVDASPTAGTKHNRYQTQLGGNIGAGYSAGGIETNLTLRFLGAESSPKDDFYKSNTNSTVMVKSDVKFYY